MVRSAAKNFEAVAVVTDPSQYPAIIAEIEQHGGLSAETRRQLAAAAFARTASYDAAIAQWFARAAGPFGTTVARSTPLWTDSP